jgi:hypothetical protein
MGFSVAVAKCVPEGSSVSQSGGNDVAQTAFLGNIGWLGGFRLGCLFGRLDENCVGGFCAIPCSMRSGLVSYRSSR